MRLILKPGIPDRKSRRREGLASAITVMLVLFSSAPSANFNFDASQEVQVLTGQHIDFIVEMFNVLHLRDKTDIETADLPIGRPYRYGDFKGQREGFQATLGARYRY